MRFPSGPAALALLQPLVDPRLPLPHRVPVIRILALIALLAVLLSGCPLIEDTRVPDAGGDTRR